MKKNYYLYAGYYELHISAHELPRPFTLISRHRKFERAMEAADKFDSDAYRVYYKDTTKDYCEYLGFREDDLFSDEISFTIADAEEIEYEKDIDEPYKPKYKWFDVENPYGVIDF